MIAGAGVARRALREAVEALHGQERQVLAVAALSLALAALEGASVMLIVPFLQSLRPGAEARLRQLVLLVGALIVLRAACAWAHGALTARLQLRVLLSLRESLALACYRARYGDLAALGPGRLVNLFSVQTERLVGAVGALAALATAALLLLVYGAALVVLSWRASVAAALVGFVAFLVAWLAGRKIRAHAARLALAEADSAALAADDAAGLHVIRAYDAGPARLVLHRHANERLMTEAMGLYRWRGALKPATDALIAVVVLGALLVALTLLGPRLLDAVPQVLAFAFVLTRLQTQLAAGVEAFSTLAEDEGASLGVFAFLEGHGSREPDGARSAPGTIGRMAAASVAFAYRPDAPVLHDLDLELKRGEIAAVVGASGAGKSTLAQLLVRLRSPDAGRIVLDGVRLDEVARASLARQLGVVFEDAFVFDESVEWNVALGRDLAPRAVRDALAHAGLLEVVEALPRKLATRLGTRGHTLSAGQRQRLALARAIVGAPQLLILDEATNALDALTEAAIADQLKAARPRGVTLLIAHRLSTVLCADRILVLEGGRIVASGRHEELLGSSPTYRRLVEGQLVTPEPASDPGRR